MRFFRKLFDFQSFIGLYGVSVPAYIPVARGRHENCFILDKEKQSAMKFGFS